jgi:hypothetical protein
MIGMRPEHLAGREFVTDYEFVVTTLFLSKRVAATDAKRGPAQTDGLTPELLGRMDGPIAIQFKTFDDTVAVRPEISRIFNLRGNGICISV